MLIRPITITDAKEVVRRWHRHHRAPLSGLFAIGVQAEDAICGVVIDTQSSQNRQRFSLKTTGKYYYSRIIQRKQMALPLL